MIPAVMPPDRVLRELRLIFLKKLGREEPLSRNTYIAEDLGMDSLDQISVIVELENHFEICFEPDGTHAVETIGDVADEICRCLASKSGEDSTHAV